MARDEQALRDHYLEIGPAFLCEPDEVLDATIRMVAAIMARIEVAGETLHGRTFIDEADGDWLDQHGSERSIFRLEGESDDLYRERVKRIEDRVTKPAILEAVDRLLIAGTSRMVECLADSGFSDFPGPQGYADASQTTEGLRCFRIYILAQLLSRSDTAYTLPGGTSIGTIGFSGTDSEADVSAFADGDSVVSGDIYRRIWEEIDRLRAGGIGFSVEIE